MQDTLNQIILQLSMYCTYKIKTAGMYVLKSFLSSGLYRMCESILTAATWEIINGMKIPEGAFCSICLRSNGRSHIVIASGIFKHLIDPLAIALRTKLFNPAYAAL